MSEYSKFLNYFNTKKGSESTKEAVPVPPEANLPAPEKEPVREPEKEPVKEAAKGPAKETVPVEASAPAGVPGSGPSAPAQKKQGRRFIKSKNTQVVSTAEPPADVPGTDVEKYTDRLELPQDGTEHTGYTGKINTVSANRPGKEKQKGTDTTDDRSLFSEMTAKKKDLFGAAPGLSAGEAETKKIDLSAPEEVPPADSGKSPTKPIGSGKASLLMEIAKSSAEEAGEDPDQLVLEGFLNKEQETAREETEMRSELKKARQKRINDFHFWNKAQPAAGKSEDGTFTSDAEKPEKKTFPDKLNKFTSKFDGMESGFLKFGCDEYTDANDHRASFKKLMDIRQSTFIRAMILTALGVIMLIINISAAATAAAHNGFFTILGGSNKAYIAVNLVFLIAAGITAAEDIRNGVVTLLQGHPKTDSSLAFMLFCSLIHTLSAFLTQQKIEADFHMLTGPVILLCVPVLLAKVFYYDNTRHCFKSIASKSDKSYLRNVSDKNLVASVLAESNNKDSNVVYPGKTRFISGFIKRSRASAFGGQTSSRLILINMGLSLLAGLLTMIIKSNVLFGMSVTCLGAALSFPAGCILFTGFMIAGENKALSVKSSYVRSYSDARDLASIDNIVLRAEDLFSVEITETVCTSGVNRKQAEFCAATLTADAGGLLKKAFENNSDLKDNNVPEVEELAYEDKLGFSAWISDCRVLLGSNAFLVNHNVRMPDESGVLNFIDSENKPIYLAIEGHFTAMFSARYSCSSETVKNLKVLADNGTNILIISTDPNITDAFAEKLLGLPADSVRILSKNPAEKITAQQETITDSEDAGIVFSDTASLCRCAYSAIKLDKLKKLAKLICEIGAGCGIALTVLLTLTGTTGAISWWLPLVLQILWIALCFFLPPMLTASSIPAFEKSTVRPVSVRETYTPENYTPRPRRITEEEDGAPDGISAADAPVRTDGDNLDFAFPEERQPVKTAGVSDDGDDYDDDDDELPPPRRKKRSILSFLREKSFEDEDDDYDDYDDEDDYYGDPEEDDEEEYEEEYEEDPYAYADRDIPTEELLQSSFFRDEDERPSAPVRGAAKTPLYRDDDDYDDYDDDDEYDDGILGRLQNRGGKGASALGGLLKGVAGKTATLTGKGRRRPRQDEEDSFDEYGPASDGGVFRTSSRPAVGKQRSAGTGVLKRPSIIAFGEEEPAPPKYDLNRQDELDFLNTKFEPPAVDPKNYYSDSYFSRYEERPKTTARPAPAAQTEKPAPERRTEKRVTAGQSGKK